MSNTMRLLVRTLLILVLMVLGAWLNAQLGQAAGGLGSLSYIVMYIVYLLIGITVGSMVNPRFTKPKNKWVYFIPIVIFAVIGAQWFFYPLFSVASLPWGIGNYLLQFSYLSWSLVGVFLSLAFR
ncbi:hypothetical protein [Sinanaerobacter chloroacetimidivorans]|uniref:Uncharacterized protein n=1 Tax=Sinanaerobacter chloroacetimidivorans TaxID=2818044 RepID=A0A8J7W036_9FIRM|nr:hypothetical protein [Sinanaerobacter chloroacetimidivorans]MBR0598304.1 hypothetical protein [Sinanaerobacter chloroacetimidivorans]